MRVSVATLLAFGSLAVAAVTQKPMAGGPSVPGDNPLTFCETPDSDILEITNVDIDPNPPQKGKDLKIKATGILKEAVEEGAFVLLSVKVGSIPLIRANESLCEQLEKVDRTCPLDKGELVFERTVRLPNEIPPAQFTAMADVYSKDNQRITCMEAINIKITGVANYAKGLFEL